MNPYWKWVEEFILWHVKLLFKSQHLLLSCQVEIGPPFTQKALPLELQCEKYKLQSEVVPWDRSGCPEWGWGGDMTQDCVGNFRGKGESLDPEPKEDAGRKG